MLCQVLWALEITPVNRTPCNIASCYLYLDLQGRFSGSGYSEIDPNKINLHDYPNVAKVPWTYATVLPGDCIYIPSGDQTANEWYF